jgi:LPS export ABC transporter permease LptG
VSVIVVFFERLDTVLKKGKPLTLLFSYVWSRIPELVAYGLPVASLVTTLLALGLLAKSNEVTAVKACGISLYRLTVPVVLLALAASGLAFLVQERLAPAANSHAEGTWRRIMDLPPGRWSPFSRHWALGRSKDRIYHYDYFEPASSTFGRLTVFDLDLGRWTLRRRTFAESAVLGRDTFTIRRGWVRDFTEAADAPFSAGTDWAMPTIDGKDYFIKEWKEPEEMTYGELKSYAAEVRAMGFEAVRLRVDLGEKSALPLVSLIMAFLGIPFAFSLGKKGTLAWIGLGIVLAMAYWGAVGVFRGLGYAGILPPFLAAWGANLIFGMAGILLMFRLRT